MKIDFKNLPSEAGILQQIIMQLSSEVQSLVNENQSLRDQLALLKAKRFGKSSEKLDKQIDDLEQCIEAGELDVAVSVPISGSNISSLQEKLQPKRLKLPEHLPREDVVLQPDLACPDCSGKEFRKISDDISETLEYIPSSFKVIRYIRPRCACVACDKIVQAFAPSKAIDKGKAGPGLLAHILVQKYCNHLPIYRQSQIYQREGIELARSTMTSWAGQCARLLEPLIDELKQSIFSSEQIHGDDTPVKVLALGLGKTKTGRIWCYVRDGRGFGEDIPPAVCYFYSPDRKGSRPANHLQNFNGVFHADAYSGYDKLYVNKTKEESSGTGIEEAACWAHMRRKFYEITVANNNANIAILVLEQISEIYKIEAKIKGLDPNERQRCRQKESKQLVEQLFINLKKYRDKLPQKSSTVKAINYAMNHQIALMRFLDNGKIEIDNNIAERAMRGIAIGRKNWMFAGSDNGGHTAANIYSLIETAKLNGINPQKYLQQVLATIQDYNSNKLADLLPWNIKLK